METRTKTMTIEDTVAMWTRDPDRARSVPTVTARVEDGQAAIQAGPFALRADLPAPLGGTNQAPSPTALLLSALAGCAVAFVYDTLGPQLGVRINGVEASARCAADARGLLGMDGAEPDLRDLAVDITVDSPDGEDAVAEVARVWQERCPIYLALRRPSDVAVSFRAA
ncbi:OsmC family protein [Streptomyces flavidovirens]|uniref:OsmC family protein n=1 Tax=Streptomyces flavidovirens TaxID=67298 RepID=A0ABW6RD66_9ACTN